MAKDLRDILCDERAFESVLIQAMDTVGRERDGECIDAMKNMSEDELRAMLNEIKNEKPEQPKRMLLRPVYMRIAAACAVLAILIVGIGLYVHIDTPDNAGYASLFYTYYKGDKIDWKTFDAGKDKLNIYGGPSTAAMIEEATELLSQKSKRSTRRGIEKLEYLLTLNYKRSLEHEIHWYLGLGYMKDNRIKDARAEFQKVIKLKSTHATEAEELLKQLQGTTVRQSRQ